MPKGYRRFGCPPQPPTQPPTTFSHPYQPQNCPQLPQHLPNEPPAPSLRPPPTLPSPAPLLQVQLRYPQLAAHVGQLGVDVSAVVAPWLICAFVNSLPNDSCVRVWDVFFYHLTSIMLLKVALALVDIYRKVGAWVGVGSKRC